MQKFNIVKLMSSIFTPDYSINNKFGVINLFQDISQNRFNGELYSFPDIENAPPEIPRIILSSQDKIWKLEISTLRTNFIYLNPKVSTKVVESLESFCEKSIDIFTKYKQRTDIRIQRMALVTERILKLKEIESTEYLVKKFVNKDEYYNTFKDLNAFELHALKKYGMEGFDINSWIRIKTANLKDKSRTPVIAIENDLNTFSIEEKPNNSFVVDDIGKFFKESSKQIVEITNLYF